MYQTRGQGFGSWVSFGPFWAEAVEEEVVVDTVDRFSQADRLPQVGMQGMEDTQEQELVGLPELEPEEESHLSLPPGNTRNHSKLYR